MIYDWDSALCGFIHLYEVGYLFKKPQYSESIGVSEEILRFYCIFSREADCTKRLKTKDGGRVNNYLALGIPRYLLILDKSYEIRALYLFST